MKELDKKEQDLVRLEELLQAKDRVIDDMRREIDELLYDRSELRREVVGLKDKLERADKHRLEEMNRLESILEDKDSVFYVSAQWGNNVVYAPNLKGNIKVGTKTQWGKNIVVRSFSLFPVSEDKIAEKLAGKIVDKLDKSGKKYAKEHSWKVAKISD